MIGIIGAMAAEVAGLKERMVDATIVKKGQWEFVKGLLNGKEAVVVQAGVGKVNAACCTQAMIDTFDVTHIINTGIAGSLQAKIDIGDFVLSTDAVQHDFDVTVFDYAVGQVPGFDTPFFTADKELRELVKEACYQVNPDIHVFEGRVVTGDQFIASKEKKEWLVKTFEGYCTEMEGGAIAQAASLNHVPFLIIRAISDKADDSAEMDYPSFEAKAIERSVKLMYEVAGRL